MWLFRFLRFPNLLIVALTQYLLQNAILLPAFRPADLSPTLGGFPFFLFSLTTMLIAATGYVVNDIVDVEMDLLNKPEKVFVNRLISKKNAWRLYFGLTAFGFAIAFYLAVYVENLSLVLIFPAAVGMLAWYSFQLKKIPVAGNVTVAIFCAFVAGVVLFAERKTFGELCLVNPAAAQEVQVLFGGYLLFAFFSTMVREIVKDIEDLEGDRTSGCRTLPIAFGMNTAKIWAFSLAFALLLQVVLFGKWLVEKEEWAGLAFLVAGIILPLVFLIFKLKTAQVKAEFARLSLFAKLIMAAGLVLLVVIWVAW